MIFGILPSLYVVQLWCKGAGNLRRWVKWVVQSYLELLYRIYLTLILFMLSDKIYLSKVVLMFFGHIRKVLKFRYILVEKEKN